MIRRIERPPGEDWAEPLIGCRIEALWRCYHDLPALFSLYQTEAGLLAQFGGQLLVAGAIDADELAQFGEFSGARQIEGLSPSLPALPGWARTEHPILTCCDATGDCAPHIDRAPDLRRVYEILGEADRQFLAQTSLLEWMSDLRRRMRLGGGRVWLLDDAAVAAVTGIGCGLGRIALVACEPSRRREGLASALVRSLANELVHEGLTALTDAQQPALEDWYFRLGFAPVGQLAVLRCADAPPR